MGGSLGEGVKFTWKEEDHGRCNEQFWDTIVAVGNRVVTFRAAYGGHGTRVAESHCFNVKSGTWWRVWKASHFRVFGGFLVKDQIYMFPRKRSSSVLRFDTVLDELCWCNHNNLIGREHCSLGVEYIEPRNIAVAISTENISTPVLQLLDINTLTWSTPSKVQATPHIDPASVRVTRRFGWQEPVPEFDLFADPVYVATNKELIDPSTVATTSLGKTIFVYLSEQMFLLDCEPNGVFRWSKPALNGIPKSIEFPVLEYSGGNSLALVGCVAGVDSSVYSVATNKWRQIEDRLERRSVLPYEDQMAVYVNNQLIIFGGRKITKLARLERVEG